MSNFKPHRQGIELKKKHGQNFLKDSMYIDRMISAVPNYHQASIMEIGCGEGILTQAILTTACERLFVFEIDKEWADYVHSLYGSDPRLTMIVGNVLDVSWNNLDQYKPWILLANLPYHVTFPILYKVHAHRALFSQGVIMVQEEVAQKLVKKTGRDYGYTSLFFQYYFDMKLLDKVPPGAFFPPPKIFSRLLHFSVRTDLQPIVQEEEFWKFIKLCFHQPRRTLRNNLAQSRFDCSRLSDEILQKRAQQLVMQDLLEIWTTLLA